MAGASIAALLRRDPELCNNEHLAIWECLSTWTAGLVNGSSAVVRDAQTPETSLLLMRSLSNVLDAEARFHIVFHGESNQHRSALYRCGPSAGSQGLDEAASREADQGGAQSCSCQPARSWLLRSCRRKRARMVLNHGDLGVPMAFFWPQFVRRLTKET